MSRVGDAAFPAVDVGPHPGRAPWWRGQLVVALERLPQAAYVWDDDDDTIVWDDPDPDRLVWDAPFIGSGYTDVFCDMTELSIVNGEPDADLSFRAAYLTLGLRDPGDGRYRTRTADGQLLYWAVGRRVAVWWRDDDGADWWLFRGRVATWRDPMLSTDVAIEAYGVTAELANPLGREWTAGAPGDHLDVRAGAIVAASQVSGVVLAADPGDAALTVPAPSDVAPIDELRRAARSDGGIVFGDADDRLVVRDRDWRGGRPDQTSEPILSDNVCALGPTGIVTWDTVAADVDLRLAGTVRLTNEAGLSASATNPGIDPSIVYTHPDADLWTTQAEGNALARWLADNRADARLAIGNAAVYLHDRRFDYWALAIDRRIGDRVRFWHEDPIAGSYDVTLVITTLRHRITADEWIVELATTPAVAFTPIELWDWTALVWDDPNPLAVWR